MMRHFRFVALRACYEARCFKFPVSAALVAACFGSFTLWYCHVDFHLRSESYSLLVKSMQWVDAEWIHFTWLMCVDTCYYDTLFLGIMQVKFYAALNLCG